MAFINRQTTNINLKATEFPQSYSFFASCIISSIVTGEVWNIISCGCCSPSSDWDRRQSNCPRCPWFPFEVVTWCYKNLIFPCGSERSRYQLFWPEYLPPTNADRKWIWEVYKCIFCLRFHVHYSAVHTICIFFNLKALSCITDLNLYGSFLPQKAELRPNWETIR